MQDYRSHELYYRNNLFDINGNYGVDEFENKTKAVNLNFKFEKQNINIGFLENRSQKFSTVDYNLVRGNFNASTGVLYQKDYRTNYHLSLNTKRTVNYFNFDYLEKTKDLNSNFHFIQNYFGNNLVNDFKMDLKNSEINNVGSRIKFNKFKNKITLINYFRDKSDTFGNQLILTNYSKTDLSWRVSVLNEMSNKENTMKISSNIWQMKNNFWSYFIENNLTKDAFNYSMENNFDHNPKLKNKVVFSGDDEKVFNYYSIGTFLIYSKLSINSEINYRLSEKVTGVFNAVRAFRTTFENRLEFKKQTLQQVGFIVYLRNLNTNHLHLRFHKNLKEDLTLFSIEMRFIFT